STSLSACSGRSAMDPSTEAPPLTSIEPIPSDEPVLATTPPLTHEPSRVVLVTLDGVRWEDAFAGTGHAPELPKRGVVMPNLHRIVGERGAAFGGSGCASDVRVSGPTNLSLPGYMEIFSGKRVANCYWNGCPRTTTPTLLDDVRAKTSSRDVAVFSSW